jgi:hypothetical protein
MVRVQATRVMSQAERFLTKSPLWQRHHSQEYSTCERLSNCWKSKSALWLAKKCGSQQQRFGSFHHVLHDVT